LRDLKTPNVDEVPVDTSRLSELLTEHGTPVAAATLTKLRCIGGGPEYIKFGRKVRYLPSRGREWAACRKSFQKSTSENVGRASALGNVVDPPSPAEHLAECTNR
jgi:hypothetical protein